MYIILFSEKKVGDIVLGSEGDEAMNYHWDIMRQKPEDRIFMWQTFNTFHSQ